MIKKKNVKKIKKDVIKENEYKMVGDVKLYNDLFENGDEMKEICKKLEIKEEYDVKVEEIEKEKKRMVEVCRKMLNKVGDKFVKFYI